MSDPTTRAGLLLGVSSERSVGYHCARHMVESGTRVVVSCRPGSPGMTLAHRLGVPAVEIDAADDESIRRGVEVAASQLGGLDFLVHAWVHVPEGALAKGLLQVSRQEFHAVMDIGVRSLIAAVGAARPWLVESPAPRVVALTSAGGQFAIPNYHLVGIAKAALEGTVRYLAQELGPEGVLCNALSFSLIGTDAARRVLGDDVVDRSASHITKRSMTRSPIRYDQVATMVEFLCSTACQNMTGECLNVDGGYCRNYF